MKGRCPLRKCPDWIDSYLMLTENTEPPEVFHKWVAISCIAACMQRKCVLPWGRLRFYPNLYVVLIAPPGRARKGTAMDPVMQFLEQPKLGIHLAAEAITREQLIRELRNSEQSLTLSDGRMASHCSLTICNSELTVFLGHQNPQLLDDLTDWYDCKRRWTYRTKNSGEFEISGVWVNILGATTPELLRTSLPAAAIGGGLTSRMIFVYAMRKRRTIPDPFLTPHEVQLEADLLHDLEQIVMLRGEYRPTADFIEAWTEWYMFSDRAPVLDDPIFAGYCERRPSMALKLSTIMRAAHSDKLEVDAIDFNRATDLLEEVEQQMPLALSGIGQNRFAGLTARIMADLSTNGDSSFDQLMWRYRNDASKAELTNVLMSLESMGFCSYITNTRQIVLNPNFDK